MAYNNSRNPLRSLQRRIGSTISIRLKDGIKYNGTLEEYDNFMNLILTNATEYELGQQVATFAEVFIRGNNVLFIEPNGPGENETSDSADLSSDSEPIA